MQIELRALLQVLLAAATALIISFISTPLVRQLARKVGAVDVPADGRRVHDHPIPRMGGLAIFFGFILSVLLFGTIDDSLKGILLGAVIIVIMGMVDDIVPLPAWLKFIIQIGAAVVAVLFGIRIDILSNPFFWMEREYIALGIWSVPVTVLWIVGITNSVNFIDGLDGLAVGVSTIASLSLLVISMVFGQMNISVMLAALVGGCLGFIPYNFNPAKIFMGDTGALMLGYVLATLSVTGLFKYYAIISFAVPVLALALPICDMIFAIVRRISKGQNPMSPDRGHIHHRLIDMGLSQKQSVAVLYTISAVMGIAAVLITTSGELKALMLVLIFALVAVLGMFIMLNRPKQ